MSFRTAIVLSIVLHLAVLAAVYFRPKQKAPEPPKAYTVRLLEPAEQAPRPSSPPPVPQGAPRPATPFPVRPTPPPSRPKPPGAVIPSPPSTAPAPVPTTPAPAPSGPSAPSGPTTPPGTKAPTIAVPGRRPGVPRPSDIQEIIDQIAKAPTPEETKGAGITFDTEEFRYRAYMDRLKEKIEGVWEYPRSAAEKGIYGDLVIQFTIGKNGILSDAKIVRTSGFPELDKAALKALHDGEPYWPLPAGWPDKSLTVNGHFIYTLWGSYLR